MLYHVTVAFSWAIFYSQLSIFQGLIQKKDLLGVYPNVFLKTHLWFLLPLLEQLRLLVDHINNI